MEAFSDGVIAILITVMVLELKLPQGTSWLALSHALPKVFTYVLSFVYLGIYWNNHHHMLMLTERVDGLVLWANLHLLFWLSLVPFTTDWIGEHITKGNPTAPAATYGIVLFAAGVAYFLLQQAIIRVQGSGSVLKAAIGRDLKGRLSPMLYAVAIGLAFVNSWLPLGLYIAVALMWLVPDRRVERTLAAMTPPA
jgi:uncharacterized membrane protein